MSNEVTVRRFTPPAVIDTVDGAMVMVENAYLALTEAVEFQATRKIQNLAVAAAAFAREANDTRLQSRATELRTRAERKAGQMLAAAAKTGDRDAGGRGPRVGSNATTQPTLTDIGITRDQSSKWQQVAQLSDEVFEQALQTTQAITHDISTPKVLRAMRGAAPVRKFTAWGDDIEAGKALAHEVAHAIEVLGEVGAKHIAPMYLMDLMTHDELQLVARHKWQCLRFMRLVPDQLKMTLSKLNPVGFAGLDAEVRDAG